MLQRAQTGRELHHREELRVAGSFSVYDQSKVRKDLLAVGAREIAIPALDGTVYQFCGSREPLLSPPLPMARTQALLHRTPPLCRSWLSEGFAALGEVAAALQ